MALRFSWEVIPARDRGVGLMGGRPSPPPPPLRCLAWVPFLLQPLGSVAHFRLGPLGVGTRGCGPAVHAVPGEGATAQRDCLGGRGRLALDPVSVAFRSTQSHSLPTLLLEDSVMVPHLEVRWPSFGFQTPGHLVPLPLTLDSRAPESWGSGALRLRLCSPGSSVHLLPSPRPRARGGSGRAPKRPV